MITHLKEREHYEDRYDKSTVYFGRLDTETFNKMHTEFLKVVPKNKSKSHMAVFHLNLMYMLFVGNDLLDRYDKRDSEIALMMQKDQAIDERIAEARLETEPSCQHCHNEGLRIIDKMLIDRRDQDNEDVLFTLRCPKCDKNSAYWQDGSAWERLHTYCPKCNDVMSEKSTRKAKILTTTYSCPACGHKYKDVLDFSVKKEEIDPDYESDRKLFCLHDYKIRDEFREAKNRHDGLSELMKEMKEKEDNKDIYDAIAAIEKPKIADLSPLLSPALEKAGYIELTLDRPEIGKDVVVGFSCLDGRSERDDYQSCKTLNRLVDNTLKATSWRLMSGGVSYRLGYLSGKLRAYEREEDLKSLVMKDLKSRSRKRKTKNSEHPNAIKIKGNDGKDILF